MIQAFIAGNLGGDAEVKMLDGGDAVCTFTVACKVRVKKENVTQWVRCSVFGKRGEKLAQYLTKGKPVAVTGALTVRAYDKDGEARVSVDLRVEEITLMGGNTQSDERPQRQERQSTQTHRQPDRRGDGPPPAADDFGYGGGDDEIPF